MVGTKVLSFAVGPACLLHGLTAEAFPKHDGLQACLAAMAKDPKLAADFAEAEAKQEAKIQRDEVPPFRPAAVESEQRLGMRFELILGAITVKEFSLIYKTAPANIEGVKVVPNLLNEEGKTFSGVLVPWHSLPEKCASDASWCSASSPHGSWNSS